MKKTYILDANVLLHEAKSIFSFPDSIVLIPLPIIAKVDKFKRNLGELGNNARHVTRILDSLGNLGSIHEGIKLDNGSTLQVRKLEDISSNQEKAVKNICLLYGLKLKRENPNIAIVTKDLHVRITANSLGVEAVDYETGRFNEALTYSGIHYLTLEQSKINDFKRVGSLSIKGDFNYNEFVVIKSNDEEETTLGRISHHDNKVIVPLRYMYEEMVGIQALNIEQVFVCEALLDDNIKLVSLQGSAGTGKTLLAVAAGLRQVLKDFRYNRVLVSRPVMPMGKDIGFLPGSIDEKMRPWMQPIFDAVELIKTMDRQSKIPLLQNNLLELEELKIEPLTYIRGRSIPKQFMIIDEAQNLSPLELKTIITRVAKNSKIILTGDPEQIDNPYMDPYSNGLSYVTGRFRNSNLSSHIRLMKGERSELAEVAANIL